ncbi:MAG: peptidyl-alpha-hydroxyglycine alpha-amidating lyase family protein [Planctomycetota bacterium]
MMMRISGYGGLMVLTGVLLCFCGGCVVRGEKGVQFTLPDYPRVNLVGGYAVDGDWPEKPGGGEWGAVPGIAVDGEDRIWTVNRGNVPVQVYSADGEYLRSWGEGIFEAVHQIRFDGEGNVWIADSTLHTVQKFTPEGQLLLTLGVSGEPGEDERHLNRPTDMAISPSGDIFVTDGYGNNRVVHFDVNGRFIKSWGQMGVGPGQFSLPHTIAMDSRGRLYVGERNNVRIQVFDKYGNLIKQFPQVIVPWGMTITTEDEIYVCGSSPMHWGEDACLGVPPKDQIVVKFDSEGVVQEMWTFGVGQTGKEKPGELNWVHGIAVDSQGNLYLGDIKGKRMQKFVRLGSGSEAGKDGAQ